MIQALRRAIYDLAITAGQAMSISELGIPRADFDRAIPQLIRLAGEDMSLRTNPSMPLISILAEMLTSSYAPRVRP
jgi:acetaldehyde dehydrogenase/alcohol dehydrogenase